MTPTKIKTITGKYYRYSFTGKRKRKPNKLKAKYAANILLRQNTGLTMERIAKLIGLSSPGAATNNIKRAYSLLAKDEQFKNDVKVIEEMIKAA